MNNILVLGAAGFIGSHLAEELQKEGNTVFSYDRCESANPSIKSIVGNYCTEENFKEILVENKINSIIHCISTSIPRDDTSTLDTEVSDNLLPTIRILEAMKEANLKKITFISSGGCIYGESNNSSHSENDSLHPINGYGLQKLLIERTLNFYASKYGLDCRIARLSNPYGYTVNKNKSQGIIPIFINNILNQTPITLFGNTIRDYIYIDDAIDAIIRFHNYNGNHKILNIGSGEGILLSDLVSKIENITNKTFSQINKLPLRTCDVLENVLDTSTSIAELGNYINTPINDGIKALYEDMTSK